MSKSKVVGKRAAAAAAAVPAGKVAATPQTLFRESVLAALALRHRGGQLTPNGEQAIESQFPNGSGKADADAVAVRIIQRGWVE